MEVSMATYWYRFASLLFAALALIPAGAHLLALPNKMDLNAADYLVAQQIYRGWAWAGIIVVGALVSIALTAWRVRDRPAALYPTLIALACILGTQALFWAFNYPANQATHNWTTLPEHWQALRRQWEFAHAGSAVLNLAALVSLIYATVRDRDAGTAGASRYFGSRARPRFRELQEVES
jgi:hypothetical protein